MVLEQRPLAQHEARLGEIVDFDRGRPDFAVRLILQHRRQLRSDGGVFPLLTLGPSAELGLVHVP